MKVKLEFFKCMGIMLANLCHPYIVRTTVLTDNHITPGDLNVGGKVLHNDVEEASDRVSNSCLDDEAVVENDNGHDA